MHAVSNLREMALVVTAALGGGLLLERIKQPAILGYILAGIVLGPSGLGFLTDFTAIHFFADAGVLMVLFLVGINLNLRAFKRSILVSISTALLQIFFGLLVAFALAAVFGWSASLSILVGFLVSLSSTAVVVKILENNNEINSHMGRLTLGVLIAQDLAIVPMILIVKELDGGIHWFSLGFKLFFTLGLLSFLVWFLSRRQKVKVLFSFSAGHPEFPALAGLAFCFGFAALSGFLELSVAYGAFLAGLVLGNSRERTVMLQMMTPIYSVLIMSFFLCIGLLMDLPFIWKNLGYLSAMLVAVVFGKTFVNVVIFRFLRQAWSSAFLSGVILAQMGEFSFLLISLGDELSLLDRSQQQLLMTLTTLSLAVTPLWVALAQFIETSRIRHEITSISFSKMISRGFWMSYYWFKKLFHHRKYPRR